MPGKGSAANHLLLPLIVIVELRQGTVLDDSAILPYLFPRIGRSLASERLKLAIGVLSSIYATNSVLCLSGKGSDQEAGVTL